MHSVLKFLNTSPFVSGCMMLMLNFGGKHLMMEIPPGMNSFFAHPWIRKLTIFFTAFVATRNIKTAILIALLFILLSKFFMNENSSLCLNFIKKNHEEIKNIIK
jgi:hypothetical protein